MGRQRPTEMVLQRSIPPPLSPLRWTGRGHWTPALSPSGYPSCQWTASLSPLRNLGDLAIRDARPAGVNFPDTDGPKPSLPPARGRTGKAGHQETFGAPSNRRSQRQNNNPGARPGSVAASRHRARSGSRRSCPYLPLVLAYRRNLFLFEQHLPAVCRLKFYVSIVGNVRFCGRMIFFAVRRSDCICRTAPNNKNCQKANRSNA